MVVIPVLRFHQQMKGDRPADQQRRRVSRVRLLLQPAVRIEGGAYQQHQVVHITRIVQEIQECLPLRGQFSLFFQKQDIPVIAVAVQCPDHHKLDAHQQGQQGYLFFHPLQGPVQACPLCAGCGTGRLQ